MDQNITYRLFEDQDLPGLLALWEEESGWGGMTEELWRKWYLETPNGPCLVAVAIGEGGEVSGQAVFTPTQVVVGDKEIRALRISAPILRKELRQAALKLNHPFIGLYLAGASAALKQGYGMLYGLPDQNWVPFVRRLMKIADW